MSARAARFAAFRSLPLFLAAGFAAAAPAASPHPADGSDRIDPAAPAARPEQTDSPEKAAPSDLGRGLRYCRPTDLARDEPALAAALSADALVLDLRRTTSDAGAEARLAGSLGQRTAARPVFVLLGVDTPATLRAAVPAAPGVLTFANAQAGFPVGVAVSTDPVQEGAALAALAAGRIPLELVEEKIEKTRYDEARLAHGYANGHRDDEDRGPATNAPTAKKAAEPTPPLRDEVLQRAVFLHHALLALGRLPAHT